MHVHSQRDFEVNWQSFTLSVHRRLAMCDVCIVRSLAAQLRCLTRALRLCMRVCGCVCMFVSMRFACVLHVCTHVRRLLAGSTYAVACCGSLSRRCCIRNTPLHGNYRTRFEHKWLDLLVCCACVCVHAVKQMLRLDGWTPMARLDSAPFCRTLSYTYTEPIYVCVSECEVRRCFVYMHETDLMCAAVCVAHSFGCYTVREAVGGYCLWHMRCSVERQLALCVADGKSHWMDDWNIVCLHYICNWCTVSTMENEVARERDLYFGSSWCSSYWIEFLMKNWNVHVIRPLSIFVWAKMCVGVIYCRFGEI